MDSVVELSLLPGAMSPLQRTEAVVARREATILVLGDNVKEVTEPIQTLGFRCWGVGGLEELLPLLRNTKPAAILFDAADAQADNWLEALAGHDERHLMVAVALCRSGCLDHFAERWRDRPDLDLIDTPISPALLARRLDSYVERRLFRESAAQSVLQLRLADKVMNRMISSRRRSEIELQRFKQVVDAALDTVLMFEPGSLRFVYANQGAVATLGYPDADWCSLTLADLMTSEQIESMRETLVRLTNGASPSASVEASLRHSRGTLVPVQMFLQFIAAGSGSGLFVSFVTDITERVRQQALLEHRTLHDALTDLPNRILFVDRLRQSISAARRDKEPFGVMMMDLDRFKEVNDTLGHHVGDLLLQEVGKRIRLGLRESDTVARLGGDEFAILITGIHGLSDVLAVGRKVVKNVARTYRVEGHPLDIGVSIGIALFPGHGDDEVTLMRRADVAMYVAKRNHEDMVVYDHEQDRDKLLLLQLESDLRTAIDSRQMQLHFQPKLVLKDRRLVGFEALVRWHHPTRGMIPPDAFISVAERTGAIHELTNNVLDMALVQCDDWNNAGRATRVAVNLSARNVQNPDLVPYIQELLKKHRVAPWQLQLELTESDLMSDMEAVADAMRRLHDIGVEFAIDDFGTGYSSLAYLKRLPVAELKIDRSFVMNMVNDGDDLVIVHSTINMAHHLGIKVVAEGVENREAWELLQILECDIAQGYFIGKPRPAGDLSEWSPTVPYALPVSGVD
ncbi:MAG: bifunctional diguanylate cyclase/phosphodiesterase [Pseudomonadota bacterium]|nr:bifunctional diguanylate cyclase/phosphodiesterase [Pseudomonadota bacterium]